MMFRMCFAATVCFGLIATSTTAWSQSLEPAAGRFLVAAQSLQDPNFAKTVVLLLHHDDDGSIGLILNQHSSIVPAQLFPSVRGLDRYQGTLFLGGPVELSHVSVLASTETGGSPVLDGVYLSNDPATLEGLVRAGGRGERALRIFVGYAGWSSGQLGAEIAAGGWRVKAASAAQVFGQDPSTLWDSLRRGGGGGTKAAPDEPFVVRRGQISAGRNASGASQ